MPVKCSGFEWQEVRNEYLSRNAGSEAEEDAEVGARMGAAGGALGASVWADRVGRDRQYVTSCAGAARPELWVPDSFRRCGGFSLVCPPQPTTTASSGPAALAGEG